MRNFEVAARRLLASALLFAIAGCVGAAPNRWTLWYIPNQPRPGVMLNKPCHTYVFATPGQTEFAVAEVKGWGGQDPPKGADAKMYSGEDFTGKLDLGPQTVHDESNGHDVNVQVVYRIRAYLPAKLRADSNCGIAGR